MVPACTGSAEEVAGGAGSTAAGGSPIPTDLDSEPALARLSYAEVADFAENVWAPVMSGSCYGCHHQGGIGEQLKSSFVLADFNLPNALEHNFAMSRRFAAIDNDYFLHKASGALSHYGGQVVDPATDGYARLAAFSARSRSAAAPASIAAPDLAAVLAQAVIPEPSRQLRKAALALAGRLPTAQEAQAVAVDPTAGLAAGVEQYLREPALYRRLVETYNDSLLVDTYARRRTAVGLVAELPNIDWYNRVSWGSSGDAERAKLQTDVALAHEPLNLIAYIARQGRPFTEVLTANYRVVNPYSACAYGVAGQVTFAQPVTCSAGEHADYDAEDLQAITIDAGGPTVGLLSARAWLTRHPTTATNKNRHRFNTASSIFLGFNVLDAVPGPQAPSSVNQPASTMVNHGCTPCHAMLDPGAGGFQRWGGVGLWTTAKWPTDMFQAGYFGASTPSDVDPLTWLGQQMAADDRFARQATIAAYQMLTGSVVALQPPLPGDGYSARLAGHILQKQAIDAWAAHFKSSGYSWPKLVAEIVLSPLFQAADIAPTADAASSLTLASTIIHRRLMSPEVLDRNLGGVLGVSWQDDSKTSNLLGNYYMFYGGIDSMAVTTRDPGFTSFKSNITLRMAMELACATVPRALSHDQGGQAQLLRQNLLPGIAPGGAGLDEAGRRQVMAAMRLSLLGERAKADDPEVDAMSALFTGVAKGARAAGPALASTCQVADITADPEGQVRGWMAVATLLLADEKFLFE